MNWVFRQENILHELFSQNLYFKKSNNYKRMGMILDSINSLFEGALDVGEDAAIGCISGITYTFQTKIFNESENELIVASFFKGAINTSTQAVILPVGMSIGFTYGMLKGLNKKTNLLFRQEN